MAWALVPTLCDGVLVQRLDGDRLRREHLHHRSREGAASLATTHGDQAWVHILRGDHAEAPDPFTLVVPVPSAKTPRVITLVSAYPFTEEDLAHVEVLAQWLALALSVMWQEPAVPVDESVAAAVHDLMNPLTVIRINATAIRRDGADLDSHLALIERCAQRMQHIAVDMLDDVRRATDRVSLELSWIYVSDLFDEAAASVADAARSRGIQLTVGDSDRVVLCDRFRILQVLVNLLDNAIKYTPRDGHVSVTATRRDGGRTRITIADDGRGISQEDLPRLFDRYWRNSAGNGIGLATAQALAAAHETELKVTTVLGGGTTFWFDLHSAE